MSFAEKLKSDVLNGYEATKADATCILDQPLDTMCQCANEIRAFFCKESFDICTITNGKSGNCTENCKFCAQSSHHKTSVDKYSLLEDEEILNDATRNFGQGVMRFGVVTSGRTLTSEELDKVCAGYRLVRENCGISLCASHGLLSFEQLEKLREAGVMSYHNNIETSRRYFTNVCTTHTYDDKINTIKAAQKAGLAACSGVIIGMGETFEDRIDMAFELKSLGVKSIPVNILNPIKGTPFEDREIVSYNDVLRTIAMFRFILPNAFIRLAGGRSLLADKGKQAFLSGANATVSGELLTTAGISTKSDIELVTSLGYNI